MKTSKRVDFRPSVVECRIYDKGSYKERSAYRGSFVIHVLGETAEVTLLTGVCSDSACAWDQEVDAETVDYLLRLGVKKAVYEHKGKQVERRL